MRIISKALALAAAGGAIAAGTAAADFTGWGSATIVDPPDATGVNTTASDGCPIENPGGRRLYIASTRPGGAGALDLWVAHREGGGGWGEPVNLAALNTAVDEFCPTPVRGGGLFFVRRPSTCGLGDIYFTRFNRRTDRWKDPVMLACAPDGPNTVLDEMGPSLLEAGGVTQLYYSSSRAPTQGDPVPGDIFASTMGPSGFGPGSLVAELSDPAANDIQPNVRRDGLEVVLSSNRAGGAGSQDVWVATRDDVTAPWSAPVNLTNAGSPVNTAEAETRPSISRDGKRLYFGRAPAAGGPADVYLATRTVDR
jgi:hypothetical protein